MFLSLIFVLYCLYLSAYLIIILSIIYDLLNYSLFFIIIFVKGYPIRLFIGAFGQGLARAFCGVGVTTEFGGDFQKSFSLGIIVILIVLVSMASFARTLGVSPYDLSEPSLGLLLLLITSTMMVLYFLISNHELIINQAFICSFGCFSYCIVLYRLVVTIQLTLTW